MAACFFGGGNWRGWFVRAFLFILHLFVVGIHLR